VVKKRDDHIADPRTQGMSVKLFYGSVARIGEGNDEEAHHGIGDGVAYAG